MLESEARHALTMGQSAPTWWTDELVDSTINREYVYAQLRPDEQELLNRSPQFGAGLTDDTYLDWILTRAKRFFLTLVDCGVPDQIFGIVDDSYDDDDLPIPEEAVADLRLSYDRNATLDKRFYKTQFRYLIRVLEDGEHIRYADEETVAVYASGLKAAVLSLGKDGVDKVRLPTSTTQFFVRKRILLDDRPEGSTEDNVLSAIAEVKTYAHSHLLSVFGSYMHQQSIFVLFSPAPAYSLKSFVSDVPKVFDNLPKLQRRQTLLRWAHCLASALAWLHRNGRHHGAIRPSNIQIDDQFQICLGQFDNPGILGTQTKIDDIEAYQYAAPERWKRAVTMQTTAPSKLLGNSGGRTARRVKLEKQSDDDLASTRSPRMSWSTDMTRLDTANPTSTTYSFMPTSRHNYSRLQLSKSNLNASPPEGTSVSVKIMATQTDRGVPTSPQQAQNRARYDAPSAMSMASSGSNRTSKAAGGKSLFAAAPEVKTAVVQTWTSTQYDLFAADVFSMGAVILDVMTLLCKRSAGSFSRHRSAKNRTAGRGGGLADASFHANIGQVMLWGSQLQTYAADRARKGDGQAFRAVGPVVHLVKRCLEREPEDRLRSIELEGRLADEICRCVGKDHLHCDPEPFPTTAATSSQRKSAEESSNADHSPEPTLREDNYWHTASFSPSIKDEWLQLRSQGLPTITNPSPGPDSDQVHAVPFSPSIKDEWLKLRSQGLVTTTIPSPGPDSSLSSLSSFNFDYDVASETLVGEDLHEYRSINSEGRRSQISTQRDPRLSTKHLDQKSKSSQGWNNWHNNDSSVEPRLVQEKDGGFSYADDSDGGSSEVEFGQSFLLPPSRPGSMFPATAQPPLPPPQRALPARPPHSELPRSGSAHDSRSRHSARRPRTGSPHMKRPSGQAGLNEEEDLQTAGVKNTALPHRRKRPGQETGHCS